MAESPNVKLIRGAFEDFARDGWETMLPHLAPEFELTTPPGLAAEPDIYRGEEGMRRYFESFYEVMDDIRVEPKEFHEVEDWVLIPFTMNARGKTTGIDAGIEGVMAWKLRDELLVRALIFEDLESALAAIPPPD